MWNLLEVHHLADSFPCFTPPSLQRLNDRRTLVQCRPGRCNIVAAAWWQWSRQSFLPCTKPSNTLAFNYYSGIKVVSQWDTFSPNINSSGDFWTATGFGMIEFALFPLQITKKCCTTTSFAVRKLVWKQMIIIKHCLRFALFLASYVWSV